MEIVVGTTNTEEGQRYEQLFLCASRQRKIEHKYLSFVKYEKFKLDKFWMFFSLFGMALTIAFAPLTLLLWRGILWTMAVKTGFPVLWTVFCAIAFVVVLVLEWKGFCREWLRHVVNWEIVHQNASGAEHFGIFLSSRALFFRSASRVVVHIPRSRIKNFYYAYDSLSKEKTLFVSYLNTINRPDSVPLVHLNYPDPQGLMASLMRWKSRGVGLETVHKLLQKSPA